MMKNKTPVSKSIKVTEDVYMKLLNRGHKGQSLSGIIEELIDQCEQIKPTTLSKPRSIPSDTSSTG